LSNVDIYPAFLETSQLPHHPHDSVGIPNRILSSKPFRTDFCNRQGHGITEISIQTYVEKGKVVPLHAMEALSVRGGTAPTLS
jgi:hypothetical protein